VDLPPSIRAFIERELEAGICSINLFSGARAHVYQELAERWYPPFLQSAPYQALLQQLRQEFTGELEDVLVDEVQSRYLEAFILSGSGKEPPYAVGNIYLWKKIKGSIRSVGQRVARNRAPDRSGAEIRSFLSEAKKAYDAYLQASVPKATGQTVATAVSPDTRYRVSEKLLQLIRQYEYYSGHGTPYAVDRELVKDLVDLFDETQDAIVAWLHAAVWPDFRRSKLCGILSGDLQSKTSDPLLKRKGLRNLFKSVRTFRHCYIPVCANSNNQRLVLVSTGEVTPPLEEPPLELTWACELDVANVPGESELLDRNCVEGSIVSGRGGGEQRRPLILTYRSRLKGVETSIAARIPGADGEGVTSSQVFKKLQSQILAEIQHFALPSVCLMPLEKSTFVLFSPKLVVPEPTVHHFVLSVPRKAKEPEPAPLTPTSPRSPRLVSSPRSPVLTKEGHLAEPPDLTEEMIPLYGACSTDWMPHEEALLPRCVAVVTTEPRQSALRDALRTARQNLPPSPSGPQTPGNQDPPPAPPVPLAGVTFPRPPPRWGVESKARLTPYGARSDVPTLDASVLPLFQALSPETLTRLWTAVLLERPVVLKSQSRSLLLVCAEALRRLLYPFTWLTAYCPLLPVAEACKFWHAIRSQQDSQSTWFDYFFEHNPLDDSLSPTVGDYAEPVTESQQGRLPGFLVGLESCVVDAALAEARAASPAYREQGCRSWAWSNCTSHPVDDWDRAPPLSASLNSSGLGLSQRNTLAKYGELPACVRESVREMLASSFVFDLDSDSVSGADPLQLDRQAPPADAVTTLFRSVQRVLFPTIHNFGHKHMCAARSTVLETGDAEPAEVQGSDPNAAIHEAFFAFFKQIFLNRSVLRVTTCEQRACLTSGHGRCQVPRVHPQLHRGRDGLLPRRAFLRLPRGRAVPRLLDRVLPDEPVRLFHARRASSPRREYAAARGDAGSQ
jgi:hypothetical protein